MPKRFDIPQEKASAALLQFADQAQVSVLFPFHDLDQVVSRAIEETIEPAEAIARILEGTGFVAKLESPGKYIVIPIKPRADGGTIHGKVVSRKDGQPLVGARIRVAGSAAQASTDLEGVFELSGVSKGRQTLIVQRDEYISLRVEDIWIKDAGTVDLSVLRLAEASHGSEQMDEFVISANELESGAQPLISLRQMIITPSRYGIDQERVMAGAALTQEELIALPELGDDLYRSISRLPGLAADDFTARFWVRGAPQQDVLSRYDGMDLVEPFHLKDTDGTLSIIDLESVARLDLLTGGFTAEYGDHLAGVMSIETERFNRKGMLTSVGASYVGARLANQGVSADQRIHWLVTARSGFPQIALRQNRKGDEADLRPTYNDLGAKLEYDLAKGQTLSLHLLHAADALKAIETREPLLHSTYGSDYLWLRWQGDFSNGLNVETVLGYTALSTRRDGTGFLNEILATTIHDLRKLNRWSFRQDWSYTWSDQLFFRAGLDARAENSEYKYYSKREVETFLVAPSRVETDTLTRDVAVNPTGNATGGFVSSRFRPTSWLTLETGARFDRDNYAGDADVSPRINLAVSRRSTYFRAAWGYYYQPQGLQDLDVPEGETIFHRAERAEQRVVSVEHRFNDGVNLRLEGYQRIVGNPAPHWEDVYGSRNPFPEIEQDLVRIAPTHAEARGVEFIAERRSGSKYLWSASYALAKTEETLPSGLKIPRSRDQRQTLYLDFTYRPSPRFQLSVAWQLHSGWPVTEQVLEPEKLQNGEMIWTTHPGSLYGLRTPEYERLDFRAQRRFQLRHGMLRVYVDIFNALNRDNVATYNYSVVTTGSTVKIVRRDGNDLFPILPSFGVEYEF